MWESVETGSKWKDSRGSIWVVTDQTMIAEEVHIRLRRHRWRKQIAVAADDFRAQFSVSK